jgi:hypothetical protein
MSLKLKVACIGLAALLAGPALADVTLQFVPNEVTVNVGETADVDLVACMTEPILGWDVDLTFLDPTIASLAGVTVADPPWTPASSDGDGLGGLAFPDPVMGDPIALATLTLQGDMVGDTTFSITTDAPLEGFALDPSGLDEWLSCVGTIHVIPEPASLALLALIGLIRRR